MIEAKGLNGKVILDGDKIIIERKGFIAFGTQGIKGNKDIYIDQISSVQFKKADMLLSGYIQFAFLGGQESKAGILNAPLDENTVTFNYWQRKPFEALKTELDRCIKSARRNVSSGSGLDDLEKLAALREKGIITEEEFNSKKKQILGI